MQNTEAISRCPFHKKEDVKSYNHYISKELSKFFTPLCYEILRAVEKTDEQQLHSLLVNIKIREVEYKSSKYNHAEKLKPVLIHDNIDPHEQFKLSKNEILYFNSFIEHLNEVATLKPYNIVDLFDQEFHTYIWSPLYPNQKDSLNHAADSLVVPIGESNRENYLLMLLTTFVLLRIADSLTTLGAEIESKGWPILSIETLRGQKKIEYMRGNNIDPRILSTLDTLKEGIQSYQATLSSLTAEHKDPTTFHRFLRKIINEQIPQKIAARVPFSYTLPTIRQGIYLKDVLEFPLNKKSKIQLSSHFLEYCKQTQTLYKDSRLIVNGTRTPGLLGTGCPLVKKDAGFEMVGINYIGKAYLKIYSFLKKNIDLKSLSIHIHSLSLSKTKLPSIKRESFNEFERYNVDKSKHLTAYQKVKEALELTKIAKDICQFWFGNWPLNRIPPKKTRNLWFESNPDFDNIIKKRYKKLLLEVRDGKFLNLMHSPAQRLALIILLDQLSRNIFRGKKASFVFDKKALALAQNGIACNHDLALPPLARWFFYMPFQHSEEFEQQEQGLKYFIELRLSVKNKIEQRIYDSVIWHALEHRNTIKQFGRFPSRNSILNRRSTKEEKAYLKKINNEKKV